MNGRGKLVGVSEDGNIQEGKLVVVFQFVSEFDVGVSRRKIFSQFDDVVVRSDEKENVVNVS